MAANQLRALVPLKSRNSGNTSAIEALQLLRESHISRPDLVLRLAKFASDQLSQNSKDYWDIQEQMCHAAADLGEWEILSSVFSKIYKRFSSSWRTRLLFGYRRETLSRWPDAMKTYIELIADDPLCAKAYKRQVAVLKSQQKVPEAIALLNHYLSYFSADVEGWLELSALCLEQTRISHALFAANEALLSDPNNHAYHTHVADIYLTAGDKDSLLLARKHYAASVTLRKQNNLRPLFGIMLAARMLSRNSDLSSEESDHNQKVLKWAKSNLADVYRNVQLAANYKFVATALEKAEGQKSPC